MKGKSFIVIRNQGVIKKDEIRRVYRFEWNDIP